MKKLVAISLLFMLLFNLGGYRFVTDYMENKADQRLEAALDQDQYDEAALISIKVPTKLPYYANSISYERVDGSININGVDYKYVKRRIYNDSLELLCIPNTAKAGLQNARDDFFRLANDLVSGNNSKKSDSNHGHTIKYTVHDYNCIQGYEIDPVSRLITVAAGKGGYHHFKSILLDQPDKPPQA